jgi:hypothetical protein
MSGQPYWQKLDAAKKSLELKKLYEIDPVGRFKEKQINWKI